MSEVNRFTTTYVATEDRVRLAVELKTGEVQVLWLTRRLLNRLAGELVRRLDALQAQRPAPSRQAAAAAQRFDQQAAVGAIKRQPAVRPDPEPGDVTETAHLVTGVQIHTRKTALDLDFMSGEDSLRSLPLTEAGLRQWLGVLHGQYDKAGWEERFWPAWIAQAPGTADMRLN